MANTSVILSNMPALILQGFQNQTGILQGLFNNAISKEMGGAIQVFAAILMVLGQAGFGLLYSGLSRARNALSSYLVVLINIFIVIGCVWAVGYTFALMSGNEFIGYKRKWFGSQIESSDYLPWILHACYTLTVVNISVGGFLERAKPMAYFIIAFFLAFFIHPVTVHWAWDTEGWLQTAHLRNDTSVVFKDTGGSCIIHVTGGIVGFLGALFCQRRRERVKYTCCNRIRVLHSHSAPMTALGGVIVYCGLIALQISRVVSININAKADLVAMVIMNIFCASLGSSMLIYLIARILNSSAQHGSDTDFRWPMVHVVVNGLIVGAVSVAAGCDSYYSYFAFVVGVIGGLVYMIYSYILHRLRVDDPAESFAVHVGPGFWGLLAAPIYSFTFGAAYNTEVKGSYKDSPYLIFSWNLIGGIAILAWCLLLSSFILFALYLSKALRIDRKSEGDGVDMEVFGEFAYPIDAWRRELLHEKKHPMVPDSVTVSSSESVISCKHKYWDRCRYIPELEKSKHSHHSCHPCYHAIPRVKSLKKQPCGGYH